MAKDNPFEYAGLGMMGSDASYAKAGMSGKGPLNTLIGKGFDWLGDQFSSKPAPEGAVPNPYPANAPVVAPQPMASVNYGFNGSLNMPTLNSPVAPYSQVAPVTAGATTTNTDNSQFTAGGYRKFLRPQGFGTTAQ
jgi:hypothetical protein